MTNDDNLESSLPTSSLLKMCCLVQVLVQVELCVYCLVVGDELTVQGRIQGGAPGAWAPPLTTKNEAPAPKILQN